mgnify:CR=1 FL=1
MAVGLIKKQIVHTSKNDASPLKIFAGAGNMDKLRDAERDFRTEMTAYREQKFVNPYAENVYANLENPFEDLTVNQQAAQFQAEQTQQSQANILSALQAGGGFNAGNIQALANQAQKGARQAAAEIGRQEAANQKLAAQQSARNQALKAQGQLQVQRGAAQLQQMEADKQATQLGMSMQMVGNVQDQIAANKAMWGQIVGGVLDMAGQLGAAKLSAPKPKPGGGNDDPPPLPNPNNNNNNNNSGGGYDDGTYQGIDDDTYYNIG